MNQKWFLKKLKVNLKLILMVLYHNMKIKKINWKLKMVIYIRFVFVFYGYYSFEYIFFSHILWEIRAKKKEKNPPLYKIAKNCQRRVKQIIWTRFENSKFRLQIDFWLLKIIWMFVEIFELVQISVGSGFFGVRDSNMN